MDAKICVSARLVDQVGSTHDGRQNSKELGRRVSAGDDPQSTDVEDKSDDEEGDALAGGIQSLRLDRPDASIS
jgi:hypothetical protein